MNSFRIGSCPWLTGLVALFVLTLPGCRDGDLDRAAWTERGKAALGPFKTKLMGALKEGLEAGPETAIEVCQLRAPEIADEASAPGVEMGRTSHRLRNGRNAPREWVRPLLASYVETPEKTGPEVVRIGEEAVGYVEPIFVKEMCLSCHGSDLSPGVASRIDDQYPGDQARGFREGDFRGLFWVEFRTAVEHR